GYSYGAGRDKLHAELADLADALLQGDDAGAWQARPIEQLVPTQAERRGVQEADVATPKVAIFTLVRGWLLYTSGAAGDPAAAASRAGAAAGAGCVLYHEVIGHHAPPPGRKLED
ncbi:phosphonate C-P lyase system protein PhnG, partial [Pseudomonas aeruginosa]